MGIGGVRVGDIVNPCQTISFAGAHYVQTDMNRSAGDSAAFCFPKEIGEIWRNACVSAGSRRVQSDWTFGQ